MKHVLSRANRSPTVYGLLWALAASCVSCLQRPVKEQTPNTSNVFVERVPINAIKTIDMLFVIDNSVSMGDKQDILKVAVPKMVERLVAPNCIDVETKEYVARSQLQGNDLPPACPSGAKLEFNPVNDIHLGIVSSSLGDHGGTACPQEDNDNDSLIWYKDDRANLVPMVRPITDQGETDPNTGESLGFLAWTGGDEAAAKTLNERFTNHVTAVGELGCGYEATLEAWYRFLVDPAPPHDIAVNAQSDRSEPVGPKESPAEWVEKSVLAQRAAFLRPEGLLAIVMLSDENDCSIMDGGDYYNNAQFGYLLTTDDHVTVATQVCETNPNDACCLSCLQAKEAPSQCRAAVDAACNPGGRPPVLDDDTDAVNVRCFNNKQRFGVDLLYPTQRYVDALTRTEIIDARTGSTVDNPIFRSQGKVREPDRVFLAGIVGVPWQDIATPESLNPDKPDTMRYLSAADLAEKNVEVAGVKVDRWELILGRPNLPANSTVCQTTNAACGAVPVPPLDPFMIEQIEPRTEGLTHPIVPSEAISLATSLDPQDNQINGHEYATDFVERGWKNDDLQYACTFRLTAPKNAATCAESVSCDCAEEPSRNRPLCQPPGGGAAEPAQYWAKAYPGTRILQVLRDFGKNSIVGSICPKVVDDDKKEDYGYNPAVQSIVDRLADKLIGTCLPREVTLDAEGKVPCFVVETKKPRDASDPMDMELICDPGKGREEVDETVKNAVRKQLAANKYCADDDHPAAGSSNCQDWQMCGIKELIDEPARGQCLYNTAPADSLTTGSGFCYIDPKKQSDDGTYIAGGSVEEAAAAMFPSTVKTPGTNTLVDKCEPTEPRILRFVGKNTPAEGTVTMVACTGDAAGADVPIPPAPMPDPDVPGEM